MSRIEIALQSTGVVSGEFGFVDAYRRKKHEIAAWSTEARPKVVAFATRYMDQLDRRMAYEQRQAEQQKELRRIAYEGEIEGC
jgi:hypothetical protein